MRGDKKVQSLRMQVAQSVRGIAQGEIRQKEELASELGASAVFSPGRDVRHINRPDLTRQRHNQYGPTAASTAQGRRRWSVGCQGRLHHCRPAQRHAKTPPHRSARPTIYAEGTCLRPSALSSTTNTTPHASSQTKLMSLTTASRMRAARHRCNNDDALVCKNEKH